MSDQDQPEAISLVGTRVRDLLAAELGDFLARTILRMAARRIGREPETLEPTDFAPLLEALGPTLRGARSPRETDDLVARIAAAGKTLSPVRPSNQSTFRGPQFIGRSDELAQLETTLRTRRLITLVGAGGIGKTRLAAELVDRVRDEFRDGVARVNLETLSDDRFVSRAVAGALGLQEAPGRSTEDLLADHLRARRVLIVLDTCEHLLAAVAELVRPLLNSSSGLRILATSREPLRVTGEAVWRVGPLSVPTDEAGSLGSDAVKLFLARAAAVDPSFELSESSVRTASEICRRLDGIPLAVELAAAQLTSLPLDHIAAGLAPSDGSSEAAPRHRTLEATMDWSHELLSVEERLLFRRLAAFAGGATLWAVGSVCEGEGIAQGSAYGLLTSLVEKSLVLLDDSRDEPRYSMLGIVHEYAAARLRESGEGEGIATRHRDWFLRISEHGEGEIKIGHDQDLWLARLERERDNLRAALTLSCHTRREAEPALRLAAALGQFWFSRGYWRESRAWLEAALEVAGDECPTLRAKVLAWTGYVAHFLGDARSARACLEESVALRRLEGDGRLIATSLRALGNILNTQGERAKASECLDEALALFTDAGDQLGVAVVSVSLGLFALDDDDGGTAARHFGYALEIYRSLGHRIGTMMTLCYLGSACEREGRLQDAAIYLDEGLVLARELDDRRQEAYVDHVMGEVSLARADAANAAIRFRRSLEASRELDDRSQIVLALEGLARVAAQEGRCLRALRILGSARSAREALAFPLPVHARDALAEIFERASAELDESIATGATAAGARMSLADAVTYALGED